MRSNVRSPTTACQVGSSSAYASSSAICSRTLNRLWASSPTSALCAPYRTPHRLQYRIFCTPPAPSHLGLQEGHERLTEGHEEPPEGHATMQNAQKNLVFGYDQQRLAGASCRIQTFAGHRIPTMFVHIRLRCPPRSDAIPPLGRVVPHGLVENAPHLGSHIDAQQPPEPRLVPTKEDRCQHLAVAPIKFIAANNGLRELCS